MPISESQLKLQVFFSFCTPLALMGSDTPPPQKTTSKKNQHICPSLLPVQPVHDPRLGHVHELEEEEGEVGAGGGHQRWALEVVLNFFKYKK